ncbi:MAG: hypothetical protein NZ941_02090, partial [Candidatus Caldarchaeum sp.]|nr:hypothetical protein [Candidatus Caldarchaeum sp.]
WAFLSDKIVKHGHVEDGVYVDLANDMRSRNCYLICGWNVEFDYNHLIAQRRMGRDYAFLRNILQRSERIDLRDPYKRAVIGLGVYSLENVSIYEGFKPKQRTKKVAELSKTELREYNNYDVELLLKIEEKYRFLERLLKMSETFNIPVSEIMAGETVVWDYLILRRLRELGYVAPRKIKRDKVEYAGAEILEPEPGLKRDVAVFDFISLYPSIILRDSVDVFGFSGEVLPYYISQFLRLKNECDAKGDSVGKDIWKILMNSAYGMFGYVGSRYYDAKKAEHITREGRKALLSVVDYLTSMGIRVYAGDTDSVFVDATTVENLSAIERMLNKRFYPLQVKLDKYFQTVLFAGREGKGVKKRYIGLTKQGKIVARGFEVRRGDWCLFTKKAVLDVASMILTGSDLQKVSEKVSEIRATLFSGKVEKQ